MKHEVAIPHADIRYVDEGEGRPIVFVHGVLVNGALWRDVARPLADEFRVIVPDWPLGAHELPLRPDADVTLPGLARMVADFLEALELEDVVLVGNDTGTAICQQTAADHPQRIGALVLTSGDAYDNFFPPLFRPLSLISKLPGSEETLALTLALKPLWRLPIAFGWLTKRPIRDDVMRAYINPLRRNRQTRLDVRRVLSAVSSSYTRELPARLASFDRPALIAWAADDKVFPRSDAERLARDIPNARLELIEDSYSFVPEDQPGPLAELIREFARVQSGAGTPAASPAPSS